MDKSAIEKHVKGILLELEQEAYQREGLLQTPERVAKMYAEVFDGYEQDPKQYLRTQFSTSHNDLYEHGIVLVRDIEFYSHCEHHMVPFFGVAHIAYIPRDKVVGLSKFARLVNGYAHRLQVQERLTEQVANAIQEMLNPVGCMVVINAKHLCMCARGIRSAEANTTTSIVRGKFENDINARQEVLQLLR